jgi:hypothetical protein
VFTLVRRARQRLLYNELLAQGANAGSAALIVLILLLLLGTQVAMWRWSLAIPVVAGGVGLYLARRRLPSPYVAAQMVDRRCGLADALSTALHFSQGEPPSGVSREIRRSQFERAGRLSQTVDVRRAIPYAMPRAVYLLAALLVAAASLFVLRYGLSRRLDLKPPLARILQQKFGGNRATKQARDARPKALENPDSRDEGTAPFSDPDEQPGVSSDPIQDAGAAATPNSASAEQAENGGKDNAPPESDDGGDAGSGEPGGQFSQKQSRPSAAKQGLSGDGENSGLLTKVEDAMENLLSSLKPPRSVPGARPQSGEDQGGHEGKGRQSGGKPGDSPEGQPGEEGGDSQDSQGKSADTRDAQQASKQPGSGIGSQDGDKNIRQAEQLAAMGKISEIIGKRSANITGEATVEVQSTSQQLRTPYAPRGAEHSQGGAEIGRDEIPVALQGYVERYFEQVRRPAPPGK